MRVAAFYLALIAICSLSACGGSGGGSSGGGGNGNENGGNLSSSLNSSSSKSSVATGATSISIDKTALTFETIPETPSSSEYINISYVGDGVIVGYPPGIAQPYWLTVEAPSALGKGAITRIYANSFAPYGQTSTTIVRFLTGRIDGSDINFVDLPVSVTVKPQTTITADKQSLSFTAELGQTTSEQLVTFSFIGDDVVADPSLPAWIDVTQVSKTADTASFSIKMNGQAPIGESTGVVKFLTNRNGAEIKSTDVTINASVKVLAMNSPAGTSNFIYGSSDIQENIQAFVADSSSAWTVTSDKSWLQVVTAHGTGNGTINFTVNGNGLAAGTYTGYITVTANNNPANSVKLAHTVVITNPTLTLGQSSILLGGKDGLDFTAQNLSFSIDTGTNAHPFKISLSTDDGKTWLAVNANTGNVQASGQTLKLSPTPSAVIGGTYTGIAKVEATIGVVKLTQQVAVTFNKEASRIVLSRTGEALSSMPSRSVLTRKIKVLSTVGRTDIPWSATADQAWLNVSSTGVTGSEINLTATKGALAAGQTYFATVTIKSSNSEVENQEMVRVGFTVLDTDANDLSVKIPDLENGQRFIQAITASPVEPLIFTNINSTGIIKAYNLYTGVEERSFTVAVAQVGNLTMSGDGQLLYVYDQTNRQVLELNAVSGATLHTYSADGAGYVDDSGFAYIRPDGRPLLIAPGSHIYDLTTQVELTTKGYVPGGFALTRPENPSLVVNALGGLFELKRSELNGGSLTINTIHDLYEHSFGQACLNAQGTRVYVATGNAANTYNFNGYNVLTGDLEQALPGIFYASNIICSWNGLIIGGANAYYDPQDIFVYDGTTGQNIVNMNSSSFASDRNLVDKGMVISGDATRLITLASFYTYPDQIRFQTLPPAP